MNDVEELIARFRESPDVQFSAQEAERLAAAGDLMAAKIAALHFFRAGEFSRCMPVMEWVLSREINEENIVNYALTLSDAGRHADAVALLREHEPRIAPIQFHSLIASCLFRLGRLAESVRHGDETLRLKDAQSPHSPPSRPLKIHTFNIETPQRNIIAFSVFGDNPRYLTGAMNNAIVARYLYPGWTVRVYTDESSPASFRQQLMRNAAEVVLIGDLPAAQYGLYWRFLVEDDENVDLFLVRGRGFRHHHQRACRCGRLAEIGQSFPRHARSSSPHRADPCRVMGRAPGQYWRHARADRRLLCKGAEASQLHAQGSGFSAQRNLAAGSRKCARP
jgi:hypothetical protein